MNQSPRPTPPGFRSPSPLARAIRENVFIAAVMTFIYQFMIGLAWMYETILRPVLRPIVRAAAWVFRRYMRLWDRIVYRKNGHFSRVRAGLMATATLGFLWLLPGLTVFVADLFLFAVFYDPEEVYLAGSQEIDSAINLHAVKGCESADCTPDNALYYRVVDNDVNSLWSWLSNGHPFYPDMVAASAGAGFSKCTVTSYGVRWKLVTRNLEWYPYMLKAHCRPVSASAAVP